MSEWICQESWVMTLISFDKIKKKGQVKTSCVGLVNLGVSMGEKKLVTGEKCPAKPGATMSLWVQN